MQRTDLVSVHPTPPMSLEGLSAAHELADDIVADLDDLITTFQPCRGGGRSRHGPGDHRVGAAEAQIDSDSGVLALVALLQASVLFGVEVDREWIAEAVDQALHGALRQLL